MATNISILQLNAPIHKAWEALTKPDLVKQWQFGSELITDWNVGSTIRFRTEWDGKVFEQWGQVQEVTPHNKIVYSLFAPRPGL
ncbi:MAG: ATPase, partial [Cytophagia bacterium]|nr:ATPase [Cytophagia bacterium]